MIKCSQRYWPLYDELVITWLQKHWPLCTEMMNTPLSWLLGASLETDLVHALIKYVALRLIASQR